MFVTFSSAVCGDHLYLHRLTHSIPSRRPSDRTRFRDQLWTGIAADHLCAVFQQLLAEHTVAAAEIENALAGLWREPVDQIRSKIGHESAVTCIRTRIPGLARAAHDANSHGVSPRRRASSALILSAFCSVRQIGRAHV